METRNGQAVRMVALAGAALVYAGAVIYGDVMFLTIMQTTFPDGLLGAMAMAGAVMTAASALILPLALHFWFAPGLQYIAGIIFWSLDIAVLALNAMLAYAMATGSGLLATWAEFAPATPLLAVLGWGIMFLLDPSHKLRHAQLELESDLIDIHTEQLRQAAKDAGVSATITSGAKQRAADMAALLTGIRTPVGRNAGKAAERAVELPAQILETANNNGKVNEKDLEMLANPTRRRRSG